MLSYHYEYDNSYTPSMPVVDVVISRFEDETGIEIEAIIDTGSDASMIPLNVLRRLKVRKAGQQRINDLSGISRFVNTYPVCVRLAGQLVRINALSDRNNRPMLIGRDILNYFSITLDGLANMTEIPTE